MDTGEIFPLATVNAGTIVVADVANAQGHYKSVRYANKASAWTDETIKQDALIADTGTLDSQTLANKAAASTTAISGEFTEKLNWVLGIGYIDGLAEKATLEGETLTVNLKRGITVAKTSSASDNIATLVPATCVQTKTFCNLPIVLTAKAAAGTTSIDVNSATSKIVVTLNDESL